MSSTLPISLSRRELFGFGVGGRADVPSSTGKSRLYKPLIDRCTSSLTDVFANMLAGDHLQSDYEKAAEQYHVLGAHFGQTQIDRYFHLLLPATNDQSTVSYPPGFHRELLSRNARISTESLPPLTLPTGDAYTAALRGIYQQGFSSSLFAAGDLLSLLSRASRVTQTASRAGSFRPRKLNASYAGVGAMETGDCFITKGDVCEALQAIGGVTNSLAFPGLVLCNLGGLASLIGIVIATDGLGAIEAAELLAEGKEVCDALASNTVASIAGIVDNIYPLVGC